MSNDLNKAYEQRCVNYSPWKAICHVHSEDGARFALMIYTEMQ